MQWTMKRKWGTVAGSLLAFTTLVNAGVSDAQMRNLDNRVSALEQRRGASGMVNPPARPQVINGADVFAYGDLLYWKANENGIPLAVVNQGSASNLSDAKVNNLRGSWNFASRVGIGYDIPHDGWDLSLSWLRYNSNGHRKRIHSSTDRFIFPNLPPPSDPISNAGTGAASSAKGNWKFLLNQLDLDLGREFYVSKWMTLRPHAGVRTDWIQQKVKAEYDDFISLLPASSEVNVRYRDRWWGIGLEGGLDTQWGLGSGWSIFANMAAAILYGEHNIRMKDKDDPAFAGKTFSSFPDGTFANVRDKPWIAHPILDLQLGVRWDGMVANDHLHIGVHLGWENHIYFSQNQFPSFCDGSYVGNFVANQGDLSMEGWTLGVRLDF
jgi:hypothetical protein